MAAVHDAGSELLGYYTNFIRPPAIEPGRWRLTDRFLDIWQPVGAEARLLDADELEEAVASGAIDESEARTARDDAESVLRAAGEGRWPPRVVREYPLADVPALRLRRDDPGTYYANLVVGRLIAFGIYALGAVSLTSLAFAALTEAFHGDRPALLALGGVIGAELIALLGLSLLGRLPATRRPRPEEVLTERILFIGALITGLALFLWPDVELWRGGLMGIYGALAVFLGVFAAARLRWERRFPVLAIAGLLVCALALLVLA